MSRSVSYPSGCESVCYCDVTDFGYRDGSDEYDEFLGQDEWDFFVEDIVETASSNWKSFVICDEWLDREDRAILENSHAYIGVSEYCGLASVWLKPKDEGSDWHLNDTSGLAKNWCNQIAPKFEKLFGELKKVGTFSNGEAVYRR